MINIELPCLAYAYMGCLDENTCGIELTTLKVIVVVYDEKSKYCELTDLEGEPFPSMCITNIGFII